VLAKHSKHFSLVDVLSIGIDRIQRNFEPMKKQLEAWKVTRISDESAKLVIYRAFVQGELDVPKHLARRVHDLYFNPVPRQNSVRPSACFTVGFAQVSGDAQSTKSPRPRQCQLYCPARPWSSSSSPSRPAKSPPLRAASFSSTRSATVGSAMARVKVGPRVSVSPSSPCCCRLPRPG